MKIIGIVGRVYYNKDNQEIVQINDYLRRILSLYDDVVSILILPTDEVSYIDCGMGRDNINLEKLNFILDKCDGFIVPGGSYWYNFDEYIIRYAFLNNKPILGICLGFQAMCCSFLENRIKFDMTSKVSWDVHHKKWDKYVHGVVVKDNSLLFKILNKNRILVNSIHHDYISFFVDRLVVSGISDDGVIEAIEIKEHKFFLGIQWHPEYLLDEDSFKIFNYFVGVVRGDNV